MMRRIFLVVEGIFAEENFVLEVVVATLEILDVKEVVWVVVGELSR